MFCNRDDATARRFIWLRQMSDVKRRKSAVASSRLQKNKQRSCLLCNINYYLTLKAKGISKGATLYTKYAKTRIDGVYMPI